MIVKNVGIHHVHVDMNTKKYSTSLLLTLKEVIDKELDDRKNQHDEDIKPDTPAILKTEYLTVEEMEKIYGIEVTDD